MDAKETLKCNFMHDYNKVNRYLKLKTVPIKGRAQFYASSRLHVKSRCR